jgi:hypothetical protein
MPRFVQDASDLTDLLLFSHSLSSSELARDRSSSASVYHTTRERSNNSLLTLRLPLARSATRSLWSSQRRLLLRPDLLSLEEHISQGKQQDGHSDQASQLGPDDQQALVQRQRGTQDGTLKLDGQHHPAGVDGRLKQTELTMLLPPRNVAVQPSGISFIFRLTIWAWPVARRVSGIVGLSLMPITWLG